jgi:hypothetical protein
VCGFVITPAAREAEFDGSFESPIFCLCEIRFPFFESFREEIRGFLAASDENAIGMAGGLIAFKISFVDCSRNFLPISVEFYEACPLISERIDGPEE